MGKIVIPGTSGILKFIADEYNKAPKGTPIADSFSNIATTIGIAEKRIAGQSLENAIKGTPYEIEQFKPQATDERRPVSAFDDLGLGQRE